MNKIKKGLLKEGLNIKNFLNSYLSGWMENLGVVPLLLLAAFLLCPIFFLRFALFVFEILVLETIVQLLNMYNQLFKFTFRGTFLPAKNLCVKGFVLILCFPVLTLKSKELTAGNYTITMAKGAYQELPLKDASQYSIGNKEVLGHKINQLKSLMTIKGKKVGHSEIVIWSKKKKSIYQVYVFSKQKHLKALHLVSTLKQMNLESKIVGNLIQGKGTVKRREDYLALIKLNQLYADQLQLKVNLSKELKRWVIGEIYRTFFSLNIMKVSCNTFYLKISCTTPLLNEKSQIIINDLKKRFNINILSYNQERSLRVSLKIILLERNGSTNFSFSLDNLTGNLNDLFYSNFSKLISQNQIALSENKLNIKVLAEPSSLVQLGKEFKLQIGQEIPFLKKQNTLEWKFAGLKIKLKIDFFNNSYHVNYTSELSSPVKKSQSIKGSKESSSVLVNIGEAITLFEIGLQSKSSEKRQIPLIGDIPLLGALFQSSVKSQSFKKVTGVLLIESTK